MPKKLKEPMRDHKTICRNLAPEGWQYGGWANGYYCFQTGNYATGFTEMKLLDCDLEPNNIALMVKMGLTR